MRVEKCDVAKRDDVFAHSNLNGESSISRKCDPPSARVSERQIGLRQGTTAISRRPLKDFTTEEMNLWQTKL